MPFLRIILLIFLIIFLSYSIKANAESSGIFKGYITNKEFLPIKLKINSITKNNEDFTYFLDTNLEDNSYVPKLNLKVSTEISKDFDLTLEDKRIYIPSGTRFNGYISEIIRAKRFNKKGFYKVTFNNVICPDGEVINLTPSISSKSEVKLYNPLQHVGKATLGLLGGSLAGALFSYELGGLGLSLATHGYSLAIGAGAGGFVGVLAGLSNKGKEAQIEIGDQLNILPVSEASFNELKQISCKKLVETLPAYGEARSLRERHATSLQENQNLKLEILSVKKKKDLTGEALVKVDILFSNESKENYNLNNFSLRDSQGKEYTTSLVDFNQDLFIDFPSKTTKRALLQFYIDHPKANHWLVLKDKNFNDALGVWKIEMN